MFIRHVCCLGDVFVVDVGSLVCVCKGANRHGVGVVVGWAECAVLLNFFELLGKDGGDVVGCGLWDVYVDKKRRWSLQSRLSRRP